MARRPGINSHVGTIHRFKIHAFASKCLIEGMDELSYTLSLSDEIARFEANRQP